MLKRAARRSSKAPDPMYGVGAGVIPRRSARTALVSYVREALSLRQDDPRACQFSNTGIAQALVTVLNDLGYLVDFVDWTDKRFRPATKYDIFIGHGSYNFASIVKGLSADARRIYLSTGMHWRENNSREIARLGALADRRGVELPPERLTPNEDYSYDESDAILCLGNEAVRSTYSGYEIAGPLENASFNDPRYDHTPKDFAAGRSHFLFFAGWGNVHKGLDIALEAFKRSRAHLYVCMPIDEPFFHVYANELTGTPNIHLIGPLEMRSPMFYRLIDRCNTELHLSCAEGSPGALVECIHQGLVPLATRDSGVDIDGFGVPLDEASPEALHALVEDLSQRPASWFEEASCKAREAGTSRFSKKTFHSNLSRNLAQIIS